MTTTNNLRKLLKHPIYDIVERVADELGVETYAVGGIVRDLFLKRDSTDIDILVIGSGIELSQKVAQEISPDCKVSVYRNFGTAQLNYM